MSEVSIMKWQETGSFTLKTFLGYVSMAEKHGILEDLKASEDMVVLIPADTANAFKTALSKLALAAADEKVDAVIQCGCCDCHKGGAPR